MADRRRLAFVGLVALGALALVYFGPGALEDRGPARAATERPDPVPGGGAPIEVPLPEPTPAGEVERPAPPARASSTVRILVVDPSTGEPAAGAELITSGGASRGRTGLDGRLTLELGAGTCSIEARGPGGRSGVVELRGGESVERTLALLGTGGALRGAVVDLADRPVAGALVKVLGSDRSATTDAQGAFVLEGLLESSHRLQVRAEGHEDGSATGFAESPAGPPLRLVVRPSARLEGQIVARGAEAPTTWRVSVTAFVQATAGADGRFALEGLGGGAEVHVHVSGTGARGRWWEATRKVVLEPTGTTRVTVEVGPPGTLEGRVVRRGGSPAGMTLATRGTSVVLGQDGGFRLQEVPSGPVHVEVAPARDWSGPGAASAEVEVPPNGTTAVVELVVEDAWDVAGRLVVEGTAELPGDADVLVSRGDEGGVLQADREGRFAARGLPAGRWWFTARAFGWASVPVEIDVGGSAPEDYRFVLQRCGALRGRVLDAGGRPVAGAGVAPRPRGLVDGRWGARTDALGAFAFDRLAPGPISVGVVGDDVLGRVARRRGVAATRCDPVSVELRPGEMTEVVLRIVDQP